MDKSESTNKKRFSLFARENTSDDIATQCKTAKKKAFSEGILKNAEDSRAVSKMKGNVLRKLLRL